MSADRFDVHIDLEGVPVRMGAISTDQRAGRMVRAEFVYDPTYLARPDRLALDPATPLVAGRSVTAQLPRGIADAGPDGWGRSLLLRANRGRAMSPAELLLAVDDTSRIGALRFRTDGDWEASGAVRIPALVELADLMDAAAQVEAGADGSDAVRHLVGGGSASLGGMRPKASVLSESGRLALAKFSSRRDTISVIAWEKVCLDLAAAAGIPVPPNRLVPIGDQQVLVLDRFDRNPDGQRVAYLSAFAITDAPDAASGDYLDIGEGLTDLDTADLPGSLRQLWLRAAFNVAVRNTDDHLKNHAVLWGQDGWRLSPAFDITPDPVGGTHRATQIAGEDLPGKETHGLARLADEFRIPAAEQHRMLTDVITATACWREHAQLIGIPDTEINRLHPVLADAQNRLGVLLTRTR